MELRIRYFGVATLLLVMNTLGCSTSITDTVPRSADDLGPGYTLMQDGSGLVLRAEAERYAGGEPVSLVLDNETGDNVGYNLCFHGIERRTGTAWTLLNDPRTCITILYYLESGDSASFESVLPNPLAPGEYRFRIAVYLLNGNEYRDLVSEPFHVGG